MKKFWESKTLWVNILAIVASILQMKFGWILTPATEGIILSIINLILRSITKDSIDWGGDK